MKEYHEDKRHGDPEFPFVVYPGNLPGYLTFYPLHWHEELELIYVVSGTGSITVQAEHLTVRSGDIVVVPPQRVHSIEQLEDNTMVYYNILFRLSLLDCAYTGRLFRQGQSVPCCLRKGEPLNEKLREPVLELIWHRKQIDTEYALMIRSHLYAIMYHILCGSRVENAGEATRNSSYDKLKVVLEYLRTDCAGDISVEQAAAMCGFSASHFMKLFRGLTGSSFTQYVKNQRLDMAARLLRTTGDRVSDIAEAVGFRNLPYFTRAFGKRFHMSPLAYRENE